MITPELEMRPIARRGLTAEELELRRYAASELKGSVWSLLANGHGRRARAPKVGRPVEAPEPAQLPRNAIARPYRN